MGIDLKEYFSSIMPFHEIYDAEKYPKLHHDKLNIVVPAISSSMEEIKLNY